MPRSTSDTSADDERELVDENRGRLYGEVGAHPGCVGWPRQVHGARVVRAGTRGEEADAIWTDECGEAIIIVTADCVPVALARIGRRAGGRSRARGLARPSGGDRRRRRCRAR